MELQTSTIADAPIVGSFSLDAVPSSTIREQVLLVLAELVKKPIHKIDLDLPITAYGVDSVDAFTAIADIEEAIGIELPDSVFWDYPTVNSATAFIESLVAAD